MRAHSLALAAALAMLGTGLTGGAQAAAVSGVHPSVALGDGLVQKTAYYFQGREYCWYPGGWRGPGYYWCGYAYRRGYGWGGGYGWNNWGRGPGPAFYGYGGGPRRFERRR